MNPAELTIPKRLRSSYSKEEWNKLKKDERFQILGYEFSKGIMVAVKERPQAHVSSSTTGAQYNVCFKPQKDIQSGDVILAKTPDSVDALLGTNKKEIANFQTVETINNYARGYTEQLRA